ncbi:B3GALT1 [Mytilus edulis]|uniref:Hexosyltransferase n=1 Tax=Mytilus edulis TaxID=6550 RepID=A0A8S3RHQ9_MYTED|nr:B3GALT1 [Mytilus edulis]
MRKQYIVSCSCLFFIITTSALFNIFSTFLFKYTPIIYEEEIDQAFPDRTSFQKTFYYKPAGNNNRSSLLGSDLSSIYSEEFVRAPIKSPLFDREICGNASVYLFILIFSSPGHYNKRQAIRETWLSNVNKFTRYTFVTAYSKRFNESLGIEIQEKKDIVQFDFIDTYKNLTYKTMSSFNWIIKVCPQASYVLKVDDDNWLNTKSLLETLKRGMVKSKVGGNCKSRGSPNRDPSNKYFIPEAMYREHMYPPYCSGPAYVLSTDVIIQILNIHKHVPFFPLEDIYVGLCLKKLNINVINICGFNNLRVYANPCWMKSKFIISVHEMLPVELSKIWTTKCKGLYPLQKLKGLMHMYI